MSVDLLHQLLEGLFKDHTREWIVGFLNDIYGQEKGVDLIGEQFSINPCCGIIHQFGDELPHLKQ